MTMWFGEVYLVNGNTQKIKECVRFRTQNGTKAEKSKDYSVWLMKRA